MSAVIKAVDIDALPPTPEEVLWAALDRAKKEWVLNTHNSPLGNLAFAGALREYADIEQSIFS